MSIDKIAVIIGGAGLIALIYWFFFGKKDNEVVGEGILNVAVDGGYNPSKIVIRKGKTTTLIFERRDPNSCLEEIIIPDFKIKKYLPLNKKIAITLTPRKNGVYPMHCGMSMFHGKIIVK